jgi:phage terminase small subunit
MPLNDRQSLFAEEYIVDLNATQAAIRAGYSAKTAGQQSFTLLKNVEIQARIQELQSERSKRTQVTADRVLLELARIGFSDVRKLFNEAGHLREIGSLCDETAPAVAAIEVVTKPGSETDGEGNRTVEYVHKVKLWDKNTALDKIAKHLGMMVEKHEHTGEGGGPMVIRWQTGSDA